MHAPTFLAFDLGAESGRAVLGTLMDEVLTLDEIHRFPNEPVQLGDTLHWNLLWLYASVLRGLQAAAGYRGEIESFGIDSWSLDFGLLGGRRESWENGSEDLGPEACALELLGNPVHYRDRRTEGLVEIASQALLPRRMFELTGLTPNQIHTAFQLYALRLSHSPLLRAAETFLMIPDLLGYYLTGARVRERTNAIHTQLYDPRKGDWCAEMFGALDLPIEIMPPLVDPGTRLGTLTEQVQQATGLGPLQLVAPCTHDTGSAVAAVPAEGPADAFLSSGTWSILGALTAEPITTPEAFAARLNNELSMGFFICRNIMGLWLLQQARAAWERAGQPLSYEELEARAAQAPPGGPIVVPDAPVFLAPPDMPTAIREFCRATGQTVPDSVEMMARCILESLALSYRHGLEQFGRVLGQRFMNLRIVGGGSQNGLLCRLTADATGLFTTAGPVEATVVGNLLVQAWATGHLHSTAEMREVVRNSFELEEYEPRRNAVLEEQYGKFVEMAEA